MDHEGLPLGWENKVYLTEILANFGYQRSFNRRNTSIENASAALDYMKRTKKLTPEVHAIPDASKILVLSAIAHIRGPGGGFSWLAALRPTKS